MTKIRESLTKTFAIFAGVFVIYIVLDWGMDLTGRRRGGANGKEIEDIGSVDGNPITYRDFSEYVKQASDNQKAQTGNDPDENQLRTLRDQIWNQFVEERLYSQQMKDLGLSVTDQEINDWIHGDNPPDFLKQQFTDSTGTFNRQAYESALSNPKNKALLKKVTDFLRTQRIREKVQSVISAGIQVSEADMAQRFADQNVKYDGDFIYFDPNLFIKDNEVTVSDDDLKKYYNDHSAEYKTDPTRKLKYVMFNEVASGQDSDAIVSQLNDIISRAKAGSDFEDLAKTYSDNPPTDAFFKHGELNPETETAVFSAKIRDVVGPIKEQDGYHVVRVDSFKTGTDDFLRASHILINIQGNDSASALKQAKDIMAKIKSGGDFAALAKENSKDPGSGAKGGDLGWFGKGRMVKPFDEAAFKAKVGQVVGPVRTQFGYHIIKVTARDNRQVKMTDLKMTVRASSQTKDALSQQAQDFAYLAKENGFDKSAKELNYEAKETPPFTKNGFISGIGMNVGLNKFAFSNKVGKVSESTPLQNGFCIASVSDVNDAGMRPFDDVKKTIESAIMHDKKMDKLKAIVANLRNSLSATDSLQKLNGTQQNLMAQHFAGGTIAASFQGVGRDAGFNGGVSILSVGQISSPVKGVRGYYLVKLTAKTPFDSAAFNGQKESLRSQLLNERRNKFLSTWIDNLKKTSEIVDNRDQYYRE